MRQGRDIGPNHGVGRGVSRRGGGTAAAEGVVVAKADDGSDEAIPREKRAVVLRHRAGCAMTRRANAAQILRFGAGDAVPSDTTTKGRLSSGSG